MTTRRTPSQSAQKVERAFHRLDLGVAVLLRRSVATVLFAVAAYQAWGAWEARTQFETAEHYIGTVLFIGLIVAVGVWLWRCRQPLSEALDEVGGVRRS